jgi:hypothetical protein
MSRPGPGRGPVVRAFRCGSDQIGNPFIAVRLAFLD